MNGEQIFIGIVEKGKFKLVVPKPSPLVEVRLTSIQMQEARPPESGELDLSEYEGNAIAVQGYGGSWIYSAKVIDSGGPIVTALVKKVFGKKIGVKNG